jgi:broad specificity phosphatase PhoE
MRYLSCNGVCFAPGHYATQCTRVEVVNVHRICYTPEYMKLLLIRHGETTGDVEDRYGGVYDDYLTAKGRAQLEQTAQRLKGTAIEVLYFSTLLRACESAEILQATLHTRIEPMEGLRERNYGILGGLTKGEAKEKYPDAVEAHKDPANTDPEGESLTDFTQRVVTAFDSIVAKGGDVVAVVSHGGPIKILLHHVGLQVPLRIADGEVLEVELH